MLCPRISFAVFLAFVSGFSVTGLAHEGHEHEGHDHDSSTAHAAPDSTNTFQANGKTFRWEHRPELGQQSDKMVAAAKGGLHNNADQDPITQEIVTVVANHGLVTLGPDLKEWTLVEDQDPIFSKRVNAHGTDCFEIDGQSYWAFASTNTQEVIVSKRGKVVGKLTQPKGDEFDNPTVNAYFAAKGKFTPCDVVYLPQGKRLVVVIGYAPGDFALTAELQDGQWVWGPTAWGGKEGKGGLFSTAHGVQVGSDNGQEIVEVASRAHGRIFAFTAGGAQVRMPGSNAGYYVQLPPGSNPCNISHNGQSIFLTLLNPLPKTKTASVMVVEDGKPAGFLTPGSYESLSYMRHMHGFCPVEKDGKLFGIVLSWPNGGENKKGLRNDGQIAIFEAVEQ
ncbi:hypothetical protein SAMN06265222_12158 [Neorhodopirellula lusitana]|uniref:Uncharacterized protein n=1 Tax=Neorhodopirellula lusitana TaxID=445327 RepID=A0ABY1QPL2_9BACT|nr:hypothetical protein [Neorhodopirellula lusitana]SMP76503.1 hypothetical protein SAMN06265222_12158 [Neorhodopirellula lusitana]